MSRSMYLTDERYRIALTRFRERIAAGLPLIAWDDETIGCKDTECSWGLCSSDRDNWPEITDHLFPKQDTHQQRPAIKYRKEKHACPWDSKPEDGSTGCFWRCKIFQSPIRPTRTRALELYDQLIANQKATP